ncbi:MAG: CRP/FNR family cyclic AMP-dependent transcriptional regulator [Hyphomicrobiaceae bacterium]|jgi:CRP/FNR family cyclic AMP-dependent transcriptional regulator
MSLDSIELARLSELPLLAGAPVALIDRLAASCTKMALAPGQVVIDEGSSNDSIYLILSGEVGVKLDESDRRVSGVHLASLGVGETFGEYSMFDGEKVSATVIARTASILARFSGDVLRRELATDPAAGRTVYRNMIVTLVRRLRAKDAELDFLTLG